MLSEIRRFVRQRRSLALCIPLLAASTARVVSAQENDAPPTLEVKIEPDCDPSGDGADVLGSALLARLPEVRLIRADADFTLRWAEARGGCRLELMGGSETRYIELAANASAEDADRAASRIAWWIVTSPVGPAERGDEASEAPIEAQSDPETEEANAANEPSVPLTQAAADSAPPTDTSTAESEKEGGDDASMAEAEAATETDAASGEDVPTGNGLAEVEALEAAPDQQSTNVMPHRGAIVALSPQIFAPRTRVPFSAGFALNVLGSAETELRGVELALIANNLRGSGNGAQIAVGYNVVHGRFDGAQWSLVNVSGSHLRGAQFGLVDVARGSVEGAQFSLINFARDRVIGAQFGNINVARADVRGAQFGNINYVRGDVRGAQIGNLNIARDVDVQLGLFNYAESARASVALLSVIRTEPLYANLGANELGRLQIGLRHGSRWIQNILELDIDPRHPEEVSFGYGIGAHFGGRIVAGELDLVSRVQLNADRKIELAYSGMVHQLRANLVVRAAKRFAVFGGASYNVLIAPEDRVGSRPAWAREFTTANLDSNIVSGWVGFHGGLRF